MKSPDYGGVSSQGSHIGDYSGKSDYAKKIPEFRHFQVAYPNGIEAHHREQIQRSYELASYFKSNSRRYSFAA